MKKLKTDNREAFAYIIRAIEGLKFKRDINILKFYRCSYKYILKYNKN